MNDRKSVETRLADEYNRLVELTGASLPNLQEQLNAIDDLERLLHPPPKEPLFVVTTTSTGH